MNLHNFLYLFTALTSISLGIYVFFSNVKNRINQIWCILGVSTFLWSLGFGLMLFAGTKESAVFWARMSHVGASLIPPFYLHFVLSLVGKLQQRKKFLFFSYGLGIFFALASLSPFVITDLQPKMFFDYYFQPGFLYFGFTLMFFAIIGSAIYGVFNSTRAATGNLRNQLTYVTMASLFGFGAGATTFPLVFDIPLYPFGGLVFLYNMIITLAIIKHRLMNIELIIKKTAIFAGLFAFVSMSFVGTTFLVQEFLADVMGAGSKWAVLFSSITIITLGIRPLERYLVGLTDRFLFQKKYDYQQTLKEASEGMTLVTDMKKLLNLIIRVVAKNVRVKSAGIFQFDDSKEKYVLKIRRGINRKHTGYSLDKDNALVWWLRTHKEAVLLDEIEDWLRSERFLRKEKGLKDRLFEIKEELAGMDAAICVPSYGKGHLIGFLVLGEKMSGDIYTQQDIQLLSTLASEAAIAVENAKNFMELEKLREKERESYIQTVLALAQTVDEKDSYTHGHLEKVNYYGMRVAEELQESSEFKAVINKDDLDTALRLHDIGKIGVPDAILHKNGKLTPEEWAIMKQHCEIGARIVEPLEKLRNVGRIIKHHQEKYDGTGYPDGLKGKEIPLESRIISVVDAYHAMVSDRPYRKALSEKMAMQELKNNIGTQFDPIAVGAFVTAWEHGKIKKI